MNLKKLDKTWRDTCPDEANGLVSKRKKGNRWDKITKSAKARNKLIKTGWKKNDEKNI